MHLAGVHQQRRPGDLRSGHPLQPARSGEREQQHGHHQLRRVGLENILEVLWAPILLIHLGGQEELTAYTIEDNELWTRHTVTLVSQVAVALYAFYKSWPVDGDWKLLASAVLLFVIGVVSFSEKPWALNRASINRLASVSAKIQGTKKPSKWGVYLDDLVFSDWYKSIKAGGGGGGPHWYNCFKLRDGDNKPQAEEVLSDVDKVYMILSDLSLLAAADDLELRGTASKEAVLRPLGTSARQEMRRWLRGAFGFIYTRANVVVHPAYLTYHVLVAPVLHVAALALFATSDKRRYSRADVKTTYVLMCFTAALDVLAVFVRQLLYRAMSACPALCETMPGYNLLDAAARRAHRPCVGWLLRCAAHVGFREDDFRCNADEKYATYEKVSTTVMGDLADAKGRDLASYRFFHRQIVPPTPPPPVSQNNNQQAAAAAGDGSETEEIEVEVEVPMVGPPYFGDDRRSRPTTTSMAAWSNWALSEDLQDKCGPEIRRSLRGSFDRSVVVWHMATDLCFRTEPTSGSAGSPPWRCWPSFLRVGTRRRTNTMAAPESDDAELLHHHMNCAASISNYMAHLLNSHPEMLLTGSRQHLVTEAISEMEKVLSVMHKEDSTGRQASPEVLTRIIEVLAPLSGIKKKVLLPAGATNVPLFQIPQACGLAKELCEIGDARVRWHLMYRVWLGMLCYSASMCRGYLHAKSLGEGGEFLSYLWLVLSLRGAKTLADKLQMPEGDEAADDDQTASRRR
ncbi:unnamed protein product [Urochloa humidicola]